MGDAVEKSQSVDTQVICVDMDDADAQSYANALNICDITSHRQAASICTAICCIEMRHEPLDQNAGGYHPWSPHPALLEQQVVCQDQPTFQLEHLSYAHIVQRTAHQGLARSIAFQAGSEQDTCQTTGRQHEGNIVASH